MRILVMVMVMVASIAGACVVEEPVGEMEGVSWSATEIAVEHEAPAEPDLEPITWRPSCEHLYSCCADTKLGTTYDDPGHTRCWHCARQCHLEGPWPNETYAGKDCRYWKKKYEIREPRGECL